jgi:hypothetical protein
MAFHDDMIYKQGSFHGPLGQYDRNKVLSTELQHATIRYPTNYQCCTVKENVVLGAPAHELTISPCFIVVPSQHAIYIYISDFTLK